MVYNVPIDYNRTPSGCLARWDKHILDEDVVRIIIMVYMPVPDKNFAQSDCSTIGVHFLPLYSKMAKEMFGYGGLNQSMGP
jgi:hypothetical protein